MFANARRLWQIIRTFRQYGLWTPIGALVQRPALRWLDWGARIHHPQLPLGDRLCMALQSLGPVFIKFGQSLATRPDLISPEVAQALTQLQDRVPPFSGATALTLIDKALKKPWSTVFSCIEPIPLGSASIAQVHAAQRLNGESVVIKLLRPGIQKAIARDMRWLYMLAKNAQRIKKLQHLRFYEAVQEFDLVLHDELDLVREAANSSVLKRLLKDEPDVIIPRVYWNECTREMATFERIRGIKIDNIPALQAAGIDLVALSNRLLTLFFKQVFEHAYFHADLHAGNIFVQPPLAPGLKPSLIFIDFGIVGALSPEDQYYLAQNLWAFIQRDYRQVAVLHIESGWVPKHVRLDAFEGGIRTVCEPMFERPIKEVSFGTLLLRLFETAQRFEMQLQPQLILLQKTILNAEGIARQLNPDLNVWAVAQPIIEAWMKQRMGLGIKKQLDLLRKKLQSISDFTGHVQR